MFIYKFRKWKRVKHYKKKKNIKHNYTKESYTFEKATINHIAIFKFWKQKKKT